MNRIFIIPLLIVCALLTACKDDFDIKTIESSPRLVVYSLPAAGDTTLIGISRSVPISSSTSATPPREANATVEYLLNGNAQQVENLGDGIYRVVAHHKAGDQIVVRAKADGVAAAEASTTVPDTVKIESLSVSNVRANDGDDDYSDYWQLCARFTDNASTHDYYAVRVEAEETTWLRDGGLYYGGDDSDEPEQVTSDTTIVNRGWAYVNIQSEPLLQPLTSVDSNFGFDRSFYDDFYIFDGESINGQTYTLHLNIRRTGIVDSDYMRTSVRCRVVLYRISEACYKFLKSVNDLESNDLAQYGFAQIMPTPTNVSGGLGFVGAFSSSASQWIECK